MLARVILIALFACGIGTAHGDQPPTRIVCLGDSITDGHTYPLLVEQALRTARKPVPVLINAGIGGDTAAGMRRRLARDVLVHKPTLVTISVGVNDVLHKVPVKEYEADVDAIAERLQMANVPLLILTPTVLGPKHAEAEKQLDAYTASLRKVAKRHGARIASVRKLMQEARAAGKEMLEPDQVHLTFAGYEVLTRALLDALGHADVAVPKELKVTQLPGIILTWQVKAVDSTETPLDDKHVANMQPDDGWKRYSLPESATQKHWWFEQERQRGFALSLDKQVGAGKSYVGHAILEAPKGRKVFFNTGAQLSAIWLNGKRIYRNQGWNGWHAGKERVPAELKEGKNIILIETGAQFFLSVTDANDW